jgi:hypothetical protein
MNLSRTAATVVWIVVIAILTIVLTLVVRQQAQSPHVLLLKDSLVITAMLLFSTHTQRIYFSSLFFPYCVLVAMLIRFPGAWYQRPVRPLLAGAILVGSVLPVVLPGRRLSFAYEMLSPYAFLTLALFGMLATLVRHAERELDQAQTVEPTFRPA